MATDPHPISPDRLGWVAGLFEGEGCVVINNRKGRRRVQIYLCVTSTDLDVLERMCAWTDLGHIVGPYQSLRPNHKPVWQWTVSRSGDSVRLLKEIMPLLLGRREARAREAIAAYYAEHTPAVLAQRQAFVDRKAAGLCSHCGVNPRRGTGWCTACARDAYLLKKAG